MCGISGEVAFVGGPVAGSLIDEQLRTLAHRGPDASGSHRRNGAVISQNRLAIIDLITGDPPITNEDASIGIVLNGEIYNYRELRRDLKGAGHRFSTHGDTEVIAHLAEQHEPVDLTRRLEGMFAFALWDEPRQRLVLARDRAGKKPLYYWHENGRLVFGSEIKAVLAHPCVPRRLSERAIPAYLTFGYVPTPETFFEGVYSLPPGCVLTLSREAGVRIETYWAPPIPGVTHDTIDLSLRDAARETRGLLEAAVERRLISDVPLGAFLSGGIDSSAIVAMMAAASESPVQTFTIGFEDDEGHDERDYARTVSRHFGTEHTEFVVEPHAIDLIERLVWHHDQPFGDSSAIPTYLLAELTREHVTVALSGDGGDEIFGGYERFAAARATERMRLIPTAVWRVASRTAERVRPSAGASYWPERLARFGARVELGHPDAYISWLSYVDQDNRHALLDGRAEGGDVDWALDDFRRIWTRSAGASVTDRLLDVNFRTYLPDDLMVKTDRMSMAHGLEVRCPLLDRELVEFALRLPPSTKIRGLSLKRVFKTAVADVLPSSILERRKRGFGVPLRRWFQSDLRSYLESQLGSPSARVRKYLNGVEVDRLIAEHQKGTRHHGHALWALLTLEVFLRQEGW